MLWRGLADIAAKYLHKGDQVYIEGKLRTRSWEKDGVTRYTTEIVGDNITLLGSKSGGGSTPAAGPPAYATPSMPAAPDATDDLPF